jgi:pimeloyl-ACP methyl ester carboxylesterase
MKHKLRTIATLFVASTTTIHFINKVTTSKFDQKQILKNDEDKYYEYRFGKVRYSKKGSGKPILLIHSLDTGSSSYEFYKIVDKLACDNCVYTIDLLGYGLSDKPEITYTNYFYVQLIQEFIHNVIKEKTTILTSGDSSTIALMLNNINKELIKKMYLINPQYIFDMNMIPSKQNKFMQTLYELPIYGTFIYHLFHQNEKMKNKFLSEYFYDPAKVKEKDIDAYMESAYIGGKGNQYSFSSVQNHYTNINFLKALKENDKPIVILGGSDEENIKTNLDNYKHYNDMITTHILLNTKKLPHLENPDEVMEYIH